MREYKSAIGAVAVALVFSSAATADIIVSSSGNDSILRYSETTGAFLGALVASGSGSGGLDDPRGLAVANNQLFVVSRGTNSVLRYNAATGAFIDQFITMGLDAPADLGFGPDGNLYVLESEFTGEVLRFDGSTGSFIDSFASPVATFNTPIYLDFGFGELAVSTDTSRLFRFNGTTGVQLSSQIRDTIHGVAYGPDGNLYVKASDSANVIRRVAMTGVLEDFVAPGGVPGSRDIGFGADANLYVLAGGGVQRFDGGTGLFIDQFVSSGSGGLTDARYLTFAQPVPEPGTVALLGFGLSMFAVWTKKRVR